MLTKSRPDASRGVRGNRCRRASFEQLERRMLLTAVVVNSVSAGTGGSGVVTLSDAIAVANGSITPTTITFDPAVFAKPKTIASSGGELDLTNTSQPTTITGPASGLSITGGLTLETSVTATVSQLNMNAISNGGNLDLFDASVVNGSGITNTGTLAATNVTVAGNSIAGPGGPPPIRVAGGIVNFGVLSLVNDTIVGNSLIEISNSASGYTGIEGAAGIANFANTPVTVANTIIAGNQTTLSVYDQDTPYGLLEHLTYSNGEYGSFQSLGNNLIGDGYFNGGSSSSDIVGSSETPLDPKLAPLGDYGGSSLTCPPLLGSPAIDHGSNALIANGFTTDQHGNARIVNGTVDIGAVEYVGPASSSVALALGKANLPAAGMAGSIFRGRVSVTATNVVRIKGLFTFTIWADSSDVNDPTRISLGHFALPIALTPGHSRQFSFAIPRLPASMPGGTYQILLEGTDKTGAATVSNLSSASFVVTPRIVQFVESVGPVIPSSVAPGRIGFVRVTLEGGGNSAANGPLTLTLGLSTNGIDAVPDVSLTTKKYSVILPPHGKRVFILAFRRKAGNPSPGTFFPMVTATLDGFTTTVSGGSQFTLQ